MKTNGLYYTWKKGERVQLSAHFWTNEFSCKCSHSECVDQHISTSLINKLERVRGNLNYGLTISSGFRCKAHQSDLFSSKEVETVPQSTHERGAAADIHPLDTSNMARVHQELSKEFKAIGVAPTWFHVDERSDKERTWKYVK